MIMGLALDAVRNWLIAEFDHIIDYRYCGIQHRGFPPVQAPDFYVAIDDGGINAITGPETYQLGESINITVCVWKRQAAIPKDLIQELMLPSEVYRPQAQSLDKLERDVLKIHQNYAIVNELRTLIATAPEIYGDCPAMPLTFRGRGPNEDMSLPWDGQSGEIATFLGRRYKFRGFDRWYLQITKLEIVTPATGIPPAENNTPYGTSYLQATGGRLPYTWSIVDGQLPPGMTLQPNGLIEGTPAITGTGMFEDGFWEGMTSGQYKWPFTARVTDSATPTPSTQDRAMIFYVIPA